MNLQWRPRFADPVGHAASAGPVGDVVVLAALFAGSGTLHLVRPQTFEPIVPRLLPHKRGLVYASGLGELSCAAGLLHPRTRQLAGLASAALLLAVFPANVQMMLDINAQRRPLAKAVAIGRLPLQVPMIRTAWRVWLVGS